MVIAEYIWIDGTAPTPKLRSKTKVFSSIAGRRLMLSDFPEWSFDGSSTNQADGSASDVILKPVRFYHDPIRGKDTNAYLVICETFNADDSRNKTNYRATLREILKKHGDSEPWVGFEQEYVFMKEGRPLGWPERGYPPPQGPFYCGVGADEVSGRGIVEEHMIACLEAGIGITGINAEVMPGQWEFQVFGEDALKASDDLWVARWLLYRIAEEHGVSATLHPKPVSGDWNGSGMHTNFSTKAMRIKTTSEVFSDAMKRSVEDNEALSLPTGDGTGMQAIEAACKALRWKIGRHLSVYGAYNEQRLTGLHETCSIEEFRYGVSDRGASIRIPLHVAQNECGYLEDRRPAANADPYRVARALIKTICEER